MSGKRRAAVSLFLIIVIPIIILGGILLYDLLWIRYLDEKALKIVSAVSEAHLSRYNEYLKREYHLIAGLELGVLSESVDAYLFHNDFRSRTKSHTLSLADPENFKNIVVKSTISRISKSLLDELLGFGKWKEELSGKLKVIEEGMEGIAALITLPAEIDKMTRTRDLASLKSYVEEMRKGIAVDEIKFGDIAGEMLEEAKDLSDLAESVGNTLKDAEKKYREVKAEALAYAQKVSEFVEEIESAEEGANLCFAEIERLEELRKKDGLSEEEIARIDRDISKLEEEMDRYDRVVQKAKANLDRHLEKNPSGVDRGAFHSLIGKVKKAIRRLTAVFDNSVCDGGILERGDFSGEDLSPLGMLEKMAFVEWCIGVMSCYEKDASVEGRAIKGELEYIVSGEPSEYESLKEVKDKIAGLRLIPNVITFFQTDFKQELDAFLSAIPPPFQTIAQVICYSGCILLESRHDVSMLLEGGKIPVLKNPKDWGMTLDSLLGKEERVSSGLKEGLSYKDYLRIVIYFQEEKETVLRAMHLVDASIIKASGGEYGLRDYTVGHIILVEYESSSAFRKRKSQIIYENAYD